MQLKTKRLTIRFINEKDWKSLIEIWDDFSHSEYAQYDAPHLETETEAQEKAKRWAKVSSGKEHMFFAVCREEKMIGYIDFHENEDGYEFGYCFHSEYHGRGFARESLKALMEWLSKDCSKRFVAGTALKNLPSVRLLEAFGFVKIKDEKVSFYKDENGNDIYFDGGIFALDFHDLPFIKKKIYLDMTEIDECVAVVSKEAEVIYAGTTVYCMPVKDKNSEYLRYENEYDIHFIFDDDIPQINFYTVPLVDIFATDSHGGYIGTIGQKTDLLGNAPICYIDSSLKSYLIAESTSLFIDVAPAWKNHLKEYDGIAFYKSKSEAKNDFEFIGLGRKISNV